MAGTIAGTVGTVFNTPFDVIKTRIQNRAARTGAAAAAAAAAGSQDYTSVPRRILPLGLHIIQTEGWRALWKGFVPKVVRLGPGGGIMLVVFDQVSSWLQKNAAPS